VDADGVISPDADKALRACLPAAEYRPPVPVYRHNRTGRAPPLVTGLVVPSPEMSAASFAATFAAVIGHNVLAIQLARPIYGDIPRFANGRMPRIASHLSKLKIREPYGSRIVRV